MNGRQPDPDYLRPYADASRTHGAGFGSLLWASPTTQAARFTAIDRLIDLNGLSLLDAGCGRADLLAYLLERGVHPKNYVGIEAVDALAGAAEERQLPNASIVRADFVAEPLRLFVAADVVIFCGSLNTADDPVFFQSIFHAFQAASKAVVFNFLCSSRLAGKDYLFWRRGEDVLRFARGLSADVTSLGDYLAGDMTVRIGKV